MNKKELLHIILLGPQGSGKGTQAKMLAQKLCMEHLEIGNTLRQIAKTKTNLGKDIAGIINQGKMVPAAMIPKIVKEKLKKISKNRGIVFDGTPRRLAEIKPLENALEEYKRGISHVFFVQISQKETINRLGKRRTCGKCGTPFILGKTISAKTNTCPKCKGKIIQRSDETPEAIKKRLKLYHEKTVPVVKYYRNKDKLIKINGEQPINKVFKDILSYL